MKERGKSARRLPWLVILGIVALLTVPAAGSADEIDAPVGVDGVLSAEPGTVLVPEGNALGPAPPSEDALAPRIDLPDAEYAAARERAARGSQARPSGLSDPSGPNAPPAPQLSCEGVNQTTAGGLRPPDPDVAAGNGHIVTVTNTHVDMYVKTSFCTAPSKSVSAASFFGYTARTLFDPRVIYDQTWDRWVIAFEAFPESSTVQRYFVGVSTTSNPLGSFCNYSIDVNFQNDPDFFFDFPMLGHDQDALLFSANIFNAAGTSFKRAFVFAIAKARMYNCLGFSVPVFQPLGRITIQPPVVLDQNSNSYFVTSRPAGVATASNLGKYTATNTSKGFAMTFGGPALIAVPTYSIPPSAGQPGTLSRLDALDARFQNRSTQISNSLFQVHTRTFGATTGLPTPRWYEINTAANTVIQQGFVFESGSSHDWNPGIAANASKEVFLCWNSTLPSGIGAHQARIRCSGRQPADPLGVIGAGFSLFTSPTFYNPTAAAVDRWGDYSYVALDPLPIGGAVCAPNRRAWFFNEKVNAQAVWGTRWGRVGFC